MEKKIHEIQKLREQRHIFKDRLEAGETLASMLQPEYTHASQAMVLVIPSGGVPVGLKVSELLGLPFDLLILRKLPIPGNTEAEAAEAFFRQCGPYPVPEIIGQGRGILCVH